MRLPVWSVMPSVGASSNLNPPFQDSFTAQGFSSLLLQVLPHGAFSPARVLTHHRSLGKTKEVLMETEDRVSFDHEESMAVPHAGPGIMLLTPSMRLLYKNRRGWGACPPIIPHPDRVTAHC